MSISQVKHRLKKSSALSTERLKARSGPNVGLIFDLRDRLIRFETGGFYVLLTGIPVYLSSQTSAQKEFGFDHKAAESSLCGKTHV